MERRSSPRTCIRSVSRCIKCSRGCCPTTRPTEADLDKLMRGTLVTSPRLKNRKIPVRISDIVLRAMAPHIGQRYQRASDMLDDLIAERPAPAWASARRGRAAVDIAPATATPAGRAIPTARFCWHCQKPLHARTDRCPFCRELQ